MRWYLKKHLLKKKEDKKENFDRNDAEYINHLVQSES
jgi:hypothetical protein